MSKVKPFINKYNWEGMEFPSGPQDWENKFEQNNKKTALNI